MNVSPSLNNIDTSNILTAKKHLLCLFQTLFFFYGAGAFLSPLIAGNFLSDECNKGDIDVVSEFAFARRKRHNGIGKTYWFSRSKDNGLSLSAENPIQHEIIRISSSNVHYSFWIIALLHVSNILTNRNCWR